MALSYKKQANTLSVCRSLLPCTTCCSYIYCDLFFFFFVNKAKYFWLIIKDKLTPLNIYLQSTRSVIQIIFDMS